MTYFHSEQNMWDYVKPEMGTENGRFFLHDYNYNISKDWIPHLTPAIQYQEFYPVNDLQKTLPKLRGGVKKPKVLLADSIGTEKVLTVLRSLGMFLKNK